MKRNTYISLKASFLFIVFALNTIVGFACAAGLEMGFNTSHHAEEKAAHVHDSGHQHTGSHHAQNDQPADHDSSEKSKEDCCKHAVAKFTMADKLTPQAFNLGLHPIVFTAILSTYCYLDVVAFYTIIPDRRYFVRSHHPPRGDVRIAIQSFQI